MGRVVAQIEHETVATIGEQRKRIAGMTAQVELPVVTTLMRRDGRVDGLVIVDHDRVHRPPAGAGGALNAEQAQMLVRMRSTLILPAFAQEIAQRHVGVHAGARGGGIDEQSDHALGIRQTALATGARHAEGQIGCAGMAPEQNGPKRLDQRRPTDPAIAQECVQACRRLATQISHRPFRPRCNGAIGRRLTIDAGQHRRIGYALQILAPELPIGLGVAGGMPFEQPAQRLRRIQGRCLDTARERIVIGKELIDGEDDAAAIHHEMVKAPEQPPLVVGQMQASETENRRGRQIDRGMKIILDESVDLGCRPGVRVVYLHSQFGAILNDAARAAVDLPAVARAQCFVTFDKLSPGRGECVAVETTFDTNDELLDVNR